ncbi:cytochrome P450 [Apodospora peruviana]|uniref:Cytochrome P450 n=1 Tax=Apodospora peruviana TaxID=516989 RepID=A0AAE0LZD7_9PEZI|nr:cytochrome P450 [Apodospora peruviana]
MDRPADLLGLGGGSVELSPMKIGLYVSVVLFCANLVHRVRRWYRLRHIPGPLVSSLTSLWLFWRCLGPRIDKDGKALVDKYGPIVRLTPNSILLADVDEVIRIMSARSMYRKDDWYLIGQVQPGKDHILSMRDKEERRERKKKIAPGYSGKSGSDFEDGINRGIAALIDLIERKYISDGGPDFRLLDLAVKTHYYALDSLGEIAFSKPFGFLANDQDMHDIIKLNDQLLPVLFLASNFTWFIKLLLKWPFYYLLPRDGDNAGFGYIMGHATALIDERLNNNSKPKRDILQSFISQELTRDELKQEVSIQFFVGSDTTAMWIRMTILFLLTNPSAYGKLQTELDDAAARGLISAPIRDAEARELPYLQAVLRESIRCFPSVSAGAFYKNVPAGGDTVCGHLLPEGTRVSTVAGIYAINHSKELWGADADVFRPERWLEKEDVHEMMKILDLTFATGQFQCSGKVIAQMQVNKVVPEVSTYILRLLFCCPLTKSLAKRSD